MKFRCHRGTLSESLKTTIEIKDKKELYNIIQKKLKHYDFFFDINDMECIDFGYDERCDWHTYLIYIKNYGVIGMTNERL